MKILDVIQIYIAFGGGYVLLNKKTKNIKNFKILKLT